MRAYSISVSLLCGVAAASSEVSWPSSLDRAFVSDLESLVKVHTSGDPSPNGACIVKNCLKEAIKCGPDKDCRSVLACTVGCGKKMNQTCIFQCTSDFEDQTYDDLLYCMFNKNDCMGTKKGFDAYGECRSLDVVGPMTTYRGAPLTIDVARNIMLRGKQRGDWIVAKGKSAAYDCFDCQYLFWVQNADKTMKYVADYKIHKSDGGVRWNIATYGAFEWPSSTGRYTMNASNYGGLAHYEDWRLLGADESEDPKWIAMYYCGSAPGVGEAYEGAFILTPDGNLPTDAKATATLAAIYGKAGITLECKTDNSNCTGHPAPPNPDANTLVV